MNMAIEIKILHVKKIKVFFVKEAIYIYINSQRTGGGLSTALVYINIIAYFISSSTICQQHAQYTMILLHHLRLGRILHA